MVDGLGNNDRFHQGGTASHSVIFPFPSEKLARALVFKVLKFDPFKASHQKRQSKLVKGERITSG
jgi:hypothetical protein